MSIELAHRRNFAEPFVLNAPPSGQLRGRPVIMSASKCRYAFGATRSAMYTEGGARRGCAISVVC